MGCVIMERNANSHMENMILMYKIRTLQGTINQSFVKNFTPQMYALMVLVACLSMRIDLYMKSNSLGSFKRDSMIYVRNVQFL